MRHELLSNFGDVGRVSESSDFGTAFGYGVGFDACVPFPIGSSASCGGLLCFSFRLVPLLPKFGRGVVDAFEFELQCLVDRFTSSVIFRRLYPRLYSSAMMSSRAVLSCRLRRSWGKLIVSCLWSCVICGAQSSSSTAFLLVP